MTGTNGWFEFGKILATIGSFLLIVASIMAGHINTIITAGIDLESAYNQMYLIPLNENNSKTVEILQSTLLNESKTLSDTLKSAVSQRNDFFNVAVGFIIASLIFGSMGLAIYLKERQENQTIL